jgi:quercetin dioxygenase-like cupin family protein
MLILHSAIAVELNLGLRDAPPMTTSQLSPPERIWIAGDTLTFKATADTTDGAFTLIECEAAPGGGPPPHVHEREDEAFYVLDGRFEILIGDKRIEAGPGDFAFVPSGSLHRFSNIGDAPGRILILFTPGGIEAFFRAAGTAATSDAPAPAVDHVEIARTEAVAARHGLSIAHWAR